MYIIFAYKAPCLAFFIGLSYSVSDDPCSPFIVYGPLFIYGLLTRFVYNEFYNCPIWVVWELGYVFLKLIFPKLFFAIKTLCHLYFFYRFSKFKGELFLLNAFDFIFEF